MRLINRKRRHVLTPYVTLGEDDAYLGYSITHGFSEPSVRLTVRQPVDEAISRSLTRPAGLGNMGASNYRPGRICCLNLLGVSPLQFGGAEQDLPRCSAQRNCHAFIGVDHGA